MKDLPNIRLGGDSGYGSQRYLIYVGPGIGNSLVPIVQEDDGYIQIAAGTYGRGKFLVFPWLEYSLHKAPSDCIYDWKYDGVAYQGCANPDSDTRDWCPTALDGEGS